MDVYTAVTGVSGSGKSTLVVKVLGNVVSSHLGTGREAGAAEPTDDETDSGTADLDRDASIEVTATGVEEINRLVSVDQRPIGRTPRVRRHTEGAPARLNSRQVFVSVELLFLPGTYATRSACKGARYSGETLEVRYRDRTIADVLAMTVDEASEFLADVAHAARSLTTLQEVGLGYLRFGQPATELSGGEVQRIKLASELQRPRRGHPLFVLDEPTTGLHPADVDLLDRQLRHLRRGEHRALNCQSIIESIAQRTISLRPSSRFPLLNPFFGVHSVL